MTFASSLDFRRLCLVPALLLGLSAPLRAEEAKEADKVPENWTIHGQASHFVQGYPDFAAPYDGPQSLPASGQIRETLSVTPYLSLRMPWSGGELHFNPEYARGFGIGNSNGIAGFTNGDAQRGGTMAGALYIARLYGKQTFALGEDMEWQESGPNQLAGFIPSRRISVMAGKFAALDFFQTSNYAGDPRRQFSNWAMWAPAAWDYGADTRGYTFGAVVEAVLSPQWTLRYGAFVMPTIPNGNDLALRSDNINHAFEIAFSHNFGGRPGVIKPFAFYTVGAMGNFANAQAVMNATGLDIATAIATTRGFGATKWGFGVLVDQELSDYAGAFLRASWNDGLTEDMAFTQIDRSVSGGVVFKGAWWNLPGHSLGIAAAMNNVSPGQAQYLASGGGGIIIGDGQISYAGEYAFETFYEVPLWRDNAFLTADYQMVVNPAYNTQRSGPVHVFGVKTRLQF